MAVSPPVLTVRRNFTRPDAQTLAHFAKASTGWTVDANGRRGALDFRIHPITAATRFSGTALTVRTRARDNLAPYAALAYARPGDVLVIATDGYAEASVAGDVLLGMAKNAGIVALVTDGLVRDIAGLDAVGIPVFALGLTPNSPHKDGPGDIGLPITIGGVIVNPGDIVVGDADGVVVVARTAAPQVAAALVEVGDKEAKMDAWVRDGVKVPPWMEATLAEKGVQFLD
ncbi:MAG: RraA family protein [Casimicrobiaceae bacterium]